MTHNTLCQRGTRVGAGLCFNHAPTTPCPRNSVECALQASNPTQNRLLAPNFTVKHSPSFTFCLGHQPPALSFHTQEAEKPLPARLAEELVSQRSPQAEDKGIYKPADKQSVTTSLAQLLKMLQHLQAITFAVPSQLLCPQAHISWSSRVHLSKQSC